MQEINIPLGGCMKETEGTWVQIFDKDGKCIKQFFYAGSATYCDENKVLLEEDDERLDFYYPFEPQGD